VPDSLQNTGTQLWCHPTASLIGTIGKSSIQMNTSQKPAGTDPVTAIPAMIR